MKRKKGKRRPGGSQKSSRNRQIVLLDQRALRRKAASECKRAMDRLERAKAEWRRFEQEDRGAFGRWMASTFGALLSRLRELQAALEAKAALVEEVEEEMFFGDVRTHRAAYRKVQNRRNNPEPASDWQEAFPPPPRSKETEGNGDPFEESDFGQEILFEEFLHAFFGIDPDELSKKEYRRMFADFQANVLGQGKPPPGPKTRPQQHARAAPQPAKQENRLKELYRQLVRRLHPDMKADQDADVSALWHEVQEAYSKGNLERLEMLLAMTDLQANAIGEQTSLSQMKSVLTELRRSYNSLQRNLRDAKGDPAWNFSRLKDRSTLENRVRRNLESSLRSNEEALKELEEIIAQWAAPPKPSKKSKERQQRDFQKQASRQPTEFRQQTEFPF